MQETKKELNKYLGFFSIIFLTILSYIGVGLLFLPAMGAYIAGPSIIISWFALSLIAIYTTMLLSELVSLIPSAGGIYEFCKIAYGRFFAFHISWMVWLVGNILTSMFLVGAVQYILPINSMSTVLIKAVVCILWIVVLHYIVYRGIRPAAVMLIVFASVSVTVILLITLPSLLFMNASTYRPFFIAQTPVGAFVGVMLVLFYIYEALFGISTMSFLSEETADAKKVFPRALIIGTVIVSILAFVMVASTIGVFPTRELEQSITPFSFMTYMDFSSFGRLIIIFGTFLMIAGAAAVWVATSPRLVFALARDKLLPKKLAEVHPAYGTPHHALAFQTTAVIIFIIASFFAEGYRTLLEMILLFVMFIVSALIFAVPLLRFKQPNAERAYKAPFVYIGTLLLLIINLALLVVWLVNARASWYIFELSLFFSAVSIPLYILILLYHDERVIIKVNDSLAYLALFTENVNMPRAVRKEVLSLLGNIREKKVFEYGSSVGTLTLDLAKAVKPTGKVYATDLSPYELKILKKRLKRFGDVDVEVFHDEHVHRRVQGSIPQVDAIVSIGTMGYMDNPKQFLRNLNEHLKKGGMIVLVDYVDFFKILPNIGWMKEPETVKTQFEDAGFIVEVRKREGFFWNYLYVYGTKR